MKKIYKFLVTSGDYPGPYYRSAGMRIIEFTDGHVEPLIIGANNLRLILLEKGKEAVQSVTAEIRQNSSVKEVEELPDIVLCYIGFDFYNPKALAVLKSTGSQLIQVETRLQGHEELDYAAVGMPDISGAEYVDHEASGTELNDEGDVVTKGEGEYFPLGSLHLMPHARTITGVVCTSVGDFCDEATKEAFESAGITGISFEEIPIVD